MHAKVTEFANLLHYEFVGTRTRDPASLSNRLLPAEAGKKTLRSSTGFVSGTLRDHNACTSLSGYNTIFQDISGQSMQDRILIMPLTIFHSSLLGH